MEIKMKLKITAILILFSCCLAGSTCTLAQSVTEFVKPQTTAKTKAKSDKNIVDLTKLPLNATFSKNNGAFTLGSKDGYHTINFNGYIQADGVRFYNGQGVLHSGANLRRAQINIFGNIAENWKYVFNYDFANRILKSTYIGYTGWKDMALALGQVSPPFGLENTSDTEAITFLEMALPTDIFSPNYSPGAAFGINNKHFVFLVSGFGAGTGETDQEGHNTQGATARLFYSPIHQEGKVIHVGISGWYQKPDSRNQVTFGAGPEVKTHENEMLVTTGIISNVRNFNVVDLELAGVYGSWSAQAEFLQTHVQRESGNSNLTFSGYYGEVAYFLTGETRSYVYPAGCFANLGVTRINNKKLGAWELAARYSYVDLNSENISGGKETNVTLGLNWYPTQLLALKFNYIRAIAHNAGTENKSINTNIFALRAEVML
jgi:phosphate-selective porin OprO and OprP